MQKHKISKMLITVLALSFALSPAMVGATYSSETPTSVVSSIKLTGTDENISWTVDGYSAKGFKVVWSKNSGPTYPLRSGDKYNYYSDSSKRSDVLTPFNGEGTYYVRVCEYLGGKCGKYSNQITVSLGSEKNEVSGGVSKIVLSSVGGASIKWQTTGNSSQGFKVVWSKNSGPTYPLRSGDKYHYYAEASKNSDSLEAFDGEGAYFVRVCEYLGGKCGLYSNEIKVILESDIMCTQEYAPVCGVDGRTYYNKCVATEKKGVQVAYNSECEPDAEILKMEEKAELLLDDKMDSILLELNQLRSLVKEQQAQITYLKSLVGDLSSVTQEMQSSLNNFITYGVDANTNKLGAGERAAVVHSYKSAFGRLPEDETELEDVIRIANGRWPAKTNEEAEAGAKERFKEVYHRDPDMNNPQDDAAVTIMAYGLRQRAQNRNLESEKRGIVIFKGVFGHNPQTTEEWNVMQAITYSGATR